MCSAAKFYKLESPELGQCLGLFPVLQKRKLCFQEPLPKTKVWAGTSERGLFK